MTHLSEDTIEPFEQITHYSKPVVTKAVEAKDSRDTTKLIEALRVLSKQDPTIKVEINQETGEHLISGMGELHLEIIETKLKDDFMVPITTSEPIVVYHETIEKEAGPIEGKTPNKHSKFYIEVEPLPESVRKALDEGQIRDGAPKGQVAIQAMIDAGLDRPTAKGVVYVSNNCMLVDATHGVQYLNEVMELLIDGFEEATRDGPLAREKCSGVMVKIVDATIHEDPVHRGPAQIIPAMRRPNICGNADCWSFASGAKADIHNKRAAGIHVRRDNAAAEQKGAGAEHNAGQGADVDNRKDASLQR